MNNTPEYQHQLPKPAKPCRWCMNSHMADATECTCTEVCQANWCLFGDAPSDPFSVMFL